MNIIKFDKLDYPCALISDDRLISHYSNLLNKLSISESSCDLNKLPIDEIPDLRSYMTKSIKYKSECTFIYYETFKEFNTPMIFISPEGIFGAIDDYFKWRELYYVNE